ncbi:MAG: hypothetical protein ABSC06_02535 [Rhodopila sp.]|jgi:hypothetical protein
MFSPVFHLEPMGRLANLMIEYMVVLKFADMVRDCRISNISISAWGIHHPPMNSAGPTAVEQREQHINLPALADQVWSGKIRRIEWTGFGQRMENFLPPERYHAVFASPFRTPMGYGPEHLVCPVRAEDILHGPNPEYVLTPVEFYRDVAEMTGLTPVFIGQTHPNPYMDRIRAAFPDAIFREPQDNPLVDFETIRQSRNVVIGVSTYSWLAAWLSQSLDNIYLTVSGLFNPIQKPSVDLLPFADSRFKFFLFPINYAVSLDRHADVHRRIAPYWRLMSHEALRQQINAAPRFERNVDQALAVFDEAFYLDTNGDVAAAAQNLGPGFARAHYINHGFQERRLPTRLDPVWYASQYPLAAFEVAQGDYTDFADHYIAIGHVRGYHPCQPEQTSGPRNLTRGVREAC